MKGVTKVAASVTIVIIVAVLILGGILLGVTRGDKTMESVKNNEIMGMSIPLMDTAAPTRVKTATFALG